MSELINISEWNIKQWIQTGGTREKCFVENPDNGRLYFFKESIDKFPSEFWSEIIASKIGQQLGFKMLDYNIGILGSTPGCICESMIEQTSEELEHGINLIKKAIPGFKITNRPIILFGEVETSFIDYNGLFIKQFIDVMVFDSIIGNQDRHSENWAIIRSLDVTNLKYNKNRLFRWMYLQYLNSGMKLSKLPFKKYVVQTMQASALVNLKFAPIYDSGSSLGREIPEEKIAEFLKNDEMTSKYIRNGKSEIRWKDDKLNHFELLKYIKNKYNSHLTGTINSVINQYNPTKIKSIIDNIDKNLPEDFNKSKLSLQRKSLIYRFIDFRIQELKKILV